MSLEYGIALDVTSAKWVAGYILEVAFSDGFSHKVDFEAFLRGSAQPEIRKYLNLELFKVFTISYGNLMWNDYDLVFPIMDLYSGTIQAFGRSQSMVAEGDPEYHVDGNTAE